jgi:hypothetical protein
MLVLKLHTVLAMLQSCEPNLLALDYIKLCSHYQCQILYKALHFKRRIQYTVATARSGLFLSLFNHIVPATDVKMYLKQYLLILCQVDSSFSANTNFWND